MTVTSPKTEHHVGKGYRTVPLFPELRPHLEAVYDAAPEGTEFVITHYRDGGVNLRSQLLKIIRRAGLQPWPKLFHNLRSSRQTELEESFPSHVVCAWIGNSEKVARKHYLQVTEAHFGKATSTACSALQNPVQYAPERQRTGSQLLNTLPEKVQKTQEFATDCDVVQCTKIAVVGLEPTTYGL